MQNLEAFFKLTFGRNQGYLCVATVDPMTRKFEEAFFSYPDQLNQACNEIEYLTPTHNIYFCPMLFSKEKRKKEFVSFAPNAWSDLDRCGPENLSVKPSILIESSPNRFQALWLFDNNVQPLVAEDVSRKIAYFHKDQGADQSGWDLTQLLRVPETKNFKYPEEPVVKIKYASKSFYRVEDFDIYPDTKSFKVEQFELPVISSNLTGAELLETNSAMVPKALKRYFDETPDEASWSERLWFLELLALECGFTVEQTFVIARDSQCNKYSRDGRGETDLWKEVLRAEETFKIKHVGSKFDSTPETPTILSKVERQKVAQLPHTIVEDYVKWASSLSDAAPQYHQAGAFVILSSLISGSVVLPTSYGMIIPNLWFMILADTTLTRKSTSMDIAMDLLEELGTDSILATDGSLEGMLTALAMRPKKPSVFLRDEFSGLIDAILKKDYLAGMAEMFTKLYDGKLMKRLLKRETVEVRDPRLIIFAGGIKDKITSLLTQEHVSSGFIPRFVFITAESDIARVRPLGPPTTGSMHDKTRLMEQLREINDHYNASTTITIGNTASGLEVKKDIPAYMSQEAWDRYNKLEYDLLRMGVDSWNPAVMTPVYDRLSKSIIKAAVLVASTRRFESVVNVTLDDLLIAIRYGEEWRAFAEEVIVSIGIDGDERKVGKVLEYIKAHTPTGGLSRSNICRTFRLPARKAAEIFETLEARGQIGKISEGDSLRYVATI